MLHTCTGLPRRTIVLHMDMSVYNCLCCNCTIKMYMSVYFCARTGRFCPHKPIGHLELYCQEKMSVSVETVLFVSVVSIGSKCRNKQKIYLLISWNRPKNNRNRLSSGTFRFTPKIIFIRSRTPRAAGHLVANLKLHISFCTVPFSLSTEQRSRCKLPALGCFRDICGTIWA